MKLIFLTTALALLTSCAFLSDKGRTVASTTGGEVGNRDDRMLPEMLVTKNKYLGGRIFEIELSLSNAKGIKQVTLESDTPYDACYEHLPTVVLSEGKFTISQKFKAREEAKYTVCENNSNNSVVYNTVTAQLDNGFIVKLKPIKVPFGGILMPRKPWVGKDENPDTDVIKMETSLKREEKSEKIRDIYGKMIPTKKEVYDIRYNVSASDLNDYAGVIFANGEEFLSDNAQELADAINSKNHEYVLRKIQDVKIGQHLCFPFDCLVTSHSLVKDKFSVEVGYEVLTVSLIRKGDFTTVLEGYKNFVKYR
jgi:hypothetical protein